MAYGLMTPNNPPKWQFLGASSPQELEEFERATGKFYGATSYDFGAWKATKDKNQISRDQTLRDRADMSDFINANASTENKALATQTGADFTKYGNVLDQYLNGAMLDNRFGAALNQSEGRVNALLDNPDSIKESAAYKFRVGQGQEALQRSMGAKGMLNSGNRLMELTKYGQDMGSQEYGNQFDRLKGLNDTNVQGYLGDKNANTSRGNMLSSLYSQFGNLATNAASANNDTKIKWGQLFEQGRQNNQANALDKAKLNIGGPNPGFASMAYSYGGY